MDFKFLSYIIQEINECKIFKKSFNNYKNKLKKYDLNLIINEIYYILKLDYLGEIIEDLSTIILYFIIIIN